MEIRNTRISGLNFFKMEMHADDRGFFARNFCKSSFDDADGFSDVAQANISFNRQKGTIRGFHFQNDGHEESKSVTVYKTGSHVNLNIGQNSININNEITVSGNVSLISSGTLTASNLVYNTGDQIISGIKTFANGSNQILNTTYNCLYNSFYIIILLYTFTPFIISNANYLYSFFTFLVIFLETYFSLYKY